jgi:hypothetical protein
MPRAALMFCEILFKLKFIKLISCAHLLECFHGQLVVEQEAQLDRLDQVLMENPHRRFVSLVAIGPVAREQVVAEAICDLVDLVSDAACDVVNAEANHSIPAVDEELLVDLQPLVSVCDEQNTGNSDEFSCFKHQPKHNAIYCFHIVDHPVKFTSKQKQKINSFGFNYSAA